MNRTGVALLAVIFVVAACSVSDDLDTPCRLMTALADGGLQPIPTTDTNAVNSGFDFISTGNTDCENLICIRLANPPSGFNDDSDGFWHGRCSGTCIVTTAPNLSTDCGNQSKGLTCSQLSFDQNFINSVCGADGGAGVCDSVFGTDDPSATYCIDPNGTSNANGS